MHEIVFASVAYLLRQKKTKNRTYADCSVVVDIIIPNACCTLNAAEAEGVTARQ